MKHLKKTCILFSVFLNILFTAIFLLENLNQPTFELGVLTQDTNVGTHGNSEVLFTLPKGLTVSNDSPRFIAAAIGQFEPNRFSISVSSNSSSRVDYESKDKRWGALYSADLEK